MTIKEGDTIPDIKVMLATAEAPQEAQTAEIFAGQKTALFALPGAFTPTCSARHLPSYVEQATKLQAKGVTQIVCMSVNDAFVMGAWAESNEAGEKMIFLADGNGDFARALGLSFDGSGFGMGERAQRFSAIIEDGKVTKLNIEEPGAFDVSSADYMLGQL